MFDKKITHSVQDLLKLKIDVMTGLNIEVDVCASEVNVDIELGSGNCCNVATVWHGYNSLHLELRLKSYHHFNRHIHRHKNTSLNK